MRLAVAIGAAALAIAPAARAQGPTGPVEEGAIEQSCKSLTGGSAGAPDEAPAEGSTEFPATWPEAPAGIVPAHVFLRTPTESFNRRYEFVLRGGDIYGRGRDSTAPWRMLPLPLCIAGRVKSIALDDDEMIALDAGRRIYTMDNALKDPSLFNWTNRWGTPFWGGPGYALPDGVLVWSWSVDSPLEDKRWTDPAGNHTAIGSGKVSHIWGLRSGGTRINFWDPWLPLDESYEICGPLRGRFRAINLSASGSFEFVIGRHGDMFAREYDFDLSGNDTFFFAYSYSDQRGKGDGAPIQLPAAPWIHQPKIPGAITAQISIHKTGVDSIHRILRVEGARGATTGYWERDVADPVAKGWTFHATGLPSSRPRLDNPRRDTSRAGLAPERRIHYRLRSKGLVVDIPDFDVACTPAHVRVTDHGRVTKLLLHHIDGLRQQVRSRGLDDVPREQSGALEGPRKTFANVTLEATRGALVIKERDWTLKRVR
jgi:hypothetical protein